MGEVGRLSPGRRLPAITVRALLVRPICLEVPVRDVVSDHRPFAIVFGLATASGTRPEGIEAHQPRDAVKPASKPLLKTIAPDAASAIGPVAGLEARLDRRDELCIVDLAEGGRAVGRAWKPERETSSTSHNRLAGRMRRCLATKATLMSPPSRKKLPPS
jgi:hypothetical protein